MIKTKKSDIRMKNSFNRFNGRLDIGEEEMIHEYENS